MRPQDEECRKESPGTTCIYSLAIILFYFQVGFIFLITFDAFHYIPGGLAEQNCPDGLNDTFCSTAWKATTLISNAYVCEAHLLVCVINYARKRKKILSCGPTSSTTTALKLNIYLFAVISLLFTIKVTVISIAFTTIGGFITPIVAGAYEIFMETPDADDVSDVEAPIADDVEASDADDMDDVEAPDADDVDDVEEPDADDVDDVEEPDADDVDDVEAPDVDDVDDVEAPDVDDVDDVEAPDADDMDDVEAPKHRSGEGPIESVGDNDTHSFEMAAIAEVQYKSPNFNVSDGDEIDISVAPLVVEYWATSGASSSIRHDFADSKESSKFDIILGSE